MKISRCINCNTKPIVHEMEQGEYKYVLTHKQNAPCSNQFKLIAYHNSPEECIAKWNTFNSMSKAAYLQ